MARLPRYAIPGQPQHVIQRGTNRMAMFVDTQDYQHFHHCLVDATRHHRCAVHAYVFMTNHVHLLVTPEAADGIGRAMQAVGRRYVRHFNRRHARTGSLWEGRYRATLVDTENYLLACYRYIELNPVRAGLASRPSEYRWSSHAANAFGIHDPLVTHHNRYLALDRQPQARRSAYLELFLDAPDSLTLQMIRAATNGGWALGGKSFQRKLRDLVDRRAAPARAGRPRTIGKSEENRGLTPICGKLWEIGV